MLLITGLMVMSFPVYWNNVLGTGISDDAFHLQNCQKALVSGFLQPNSFGYSLILLAASGFTGNLVLMSWTAILLMTAATAWKGWLTMFQTGPGCSRPGQALSPIWAVSISIALVFTGPLLTPGIYSALYFGQISINVWHNATFILAMPFALVVCDCFLNRRRTGLGTLCLLASLCIKPSFAVAFLPTIVLMARPLGVPLKTILAYALPACLLLAGQYVYQNTTAGSFDNAFSLDTVIRPLAVWGSRTDNVVRSLLVSIAFPLVIVLVRGEQLVMKKKILFSWILFIVALAPYVLLAENNARFAHGNFGWGAKAALFILFLHSYHEAALFLRTMRRPSARAGLLLTTLILHLASGVLLYQRNLAGLGWDS